MSSARERDRDATPAWPAATATCRPWARWWWFGSAVNERELTLSLERFRDAGFGGVEISPIYGVTGAEERAVPYLSPLWIELLRHTLREAHRLGMGVDMIEGTGWPFGGPWVRPQDAATKLTVSALPLGPDGRVSGTVPERPALQALTAYGPDGQAVELTDSVDASGHLDWAAPSVGWSVYAAVQRPTRQAVKRAAPGGEGSVLDPYSRAALEHYLAAFEPALASQASNERLRCLFNDSFEVFGANWTPGFLGQFQRRRGYDLKLHLAALAGKANPEYNARVRSDYRETVSDLLLEEFTRPWSETARKHGIRTRNQAHGSPGNLLDLYAEADIPETEMFGPPGPPPLDKDQARADVGEILTCKLASSAAHVAGRPLCSAESMTWLGEHFQTSLADVKGQADRLFLSGVNHLFYHGAPFSPSDAPWPGWLFYASTDFTPANPIWHDLPALNGYVTRCQSFLQGGEPDPDLLLYFPIYDLWAADHGAADLLQYIRVHNTPDWLDSNLPWFSTTARLLWQVGTQFDFVSDALLKKANPRVLLVAGCTTMPPETLERIEELARGGTTVLFAGGFPGGLPVDVPGLGDVERRGERLRELVGRLDLRPVEGTAYSEARVGRGRIRVGGDLPSMLRQSGVRREPLRDAGLEVVRRIEAAHAIYFLSNRTQGAVEAWIPLDCKAEAVELFDPLRTRCGFAPVRKGESGQIEVFLQLRPGESCILRTSDRRPSGTPHRRLIPAGEPVPIEGDWRVEFEEGGPSLPEPVTVRDLKSWTEWPANPELLRAFSGTARYRRSFRRPKGRAKRWRLDLGDLRNSARVKLNGRELGTLIAPPYRVDLNEPLAAENELVVEVTNLMANRIADLDRRKVAWRKFYFVDLKYRPFDASGWAPLPSGLLGPVRLVPLRQASPDRKPLDVTPRTHQQNLESASPDAER